MKEAWHRFLWFEVTAARFWSRSSMFGDITWTCSECLKPHVFELLDQATDVVLEKRLSNGLRPDITISGRAGRPIAFIEFKKTNVSDRIIEYAESEGIPLFVVDVLDGSSEQQSLHNRQRRWYDGIRDFSKEDRQLARAAECFSGTVYEPIHDSDGHLVDAYLRYDDEDPEQNKILSLLGMPGPRRGHYLFAHNSTLGCESQRLERVPWLFPVAAAS